VSLKVTCQWGDLFLEVTGGQIQLSVAQAEELIDLLHEAIEHAKEWEETP
jgi:hypothetical protein